VRDQHYARYGGREDEGRISAVEGTFTGQRGKVCVVTYTADETAPWIGRLQPQLTVSEYGDRLIWCGLATVGSIPAVLSAVTGVVLLVLGHRRRLAPGNRVPSSSD
jgi:hypothetical protein